ncbi:MAG: ABC transporter ATP-binding protein [Lachnospiraceae bacterium]|nr:ABC transporter ATP-binding protein [Lachnospiraceae bacterium]
MQPIIEFKNYTFKYNSQTEPTLFDIDLKIYPGERVLIVGPSGSGKSTLAHCINALNPCSRPGSYTGTLTVGGLNPAEAGVFGMSGIVGTVLQDTDGQFIGLTVAEDLAFALENDAVPQEEMKKRVEKVSELIEMQPFLRRSPGALSGGQKQRVSMGGVLVDDVKILLFDEPLANLDPLTGKNAIALIDEIGKKRDVTVIIIEHRLEDALYRKVDRIIVVGEGRIKADAPPDELLCTDILNKEGIREPLYITAIRHAGGTISPEDHPASIDTMNIAPYREAVRSWYSRTPAPAVQNDGRNVLTVRDLSFSYKPGEPVLKNISFAIKEGELLALVGKNGAGKSTLSSLICGFIDPTKGSILLGDEDIANFSVKERGERIGLVMQSPNQMISKPMIREEVGLGLSVRGVPDEEIKERVEDTLKICGLYPFRNWPVGALSFGQKKRVSIASILIMQPKLLILDEPTAGQDYRRYTEFMEFIRKLNRESGQTILMITHDMHLMLEYTDRALVLADGELIADTTPAKILTDSEICKRAYLKETSLYALSLACGIDEPDGFVERFISFDREKRRELFQETGAVS